MLDYVELFAGAGGWSVGAHHLGLDGVGIEINEQACATRVAADLQTIHADVLTIDPRDYAGTPGLIASPPCQSYSVAGSGTGRRNLTRVLANVRAIAAGLPAEEIEDVNTALVLEPLIWALAIRPEWIALEQVRTVLPVWAAIGEVLTEHGYSVATGVLSSEQFGVPQTRPRAFLFAARTHEVWMPAPSHSKFYVRTPDKLDPDLKPWVSMAEALSMDPSSGLLFCPTNVRPNAAVRPLTHPAPTLAFGHEKPRWLPSDLIGFPRRSDGREEVRLGKLAYRARDLRPGDQPAFTLTEKARSWSRFSLDGDVIRVTIQEAAVLQSFPVRHPFQGSPTSQFLQVGNAVPPLLAENVLASVI